ncbi:DUF3306 domain-containing protein [Acidovorax sp. JHL-9]|uniref:DUF3306 domain-containing protein n=1 Tax=Acidovorax sp. JHL-9 TaxID=1276756 RepID=UPI00040D99D3|nr:DUF3306 domain-containing protein [Acidovorax sp. JHL-9]
MADGFLGRWSRRKQDVLAGRPVEEMPARAAKIPAPATNQAVAAPLTAESTPGANPSVVPGADAPPPPTLSDAEALTPASDFKPFVGRAVSPEVRNLAMKKLFADPHFNVMDGLDIYVGDYTQPDPLPAGMLRDMTSARAMGFFADEKKADAEASPDALVDGATADTQADAIAPAIAQPRDDAEGQTSPDVAQSGVCNAIPSDPSSELALASDSAQDAVAMPASHTHNDHDAPLRLQPDNAPQRQGAGRGTA